MRLSPQMPAFQLSAMLRRSVVVRLIVAGLSAISLSACVSTSNNESGALSSTTQEDNLERKRAKIRLELAANYFQQGQAKTALEEVNNALAADGSYADAHVFKGVVLMDAKQYPAAEISFKQALTLTPNDPDANNTYGWFLCQTNRVSDSIALFNKAAQTPFYATPAKPLQNAGICAAKQNNYPLAESYLLRAQQIDPNQITTLYHLGLVYVSMGDAIRANAYASSVLAGFRPNAETLWLGIRAARLAKDELNQVKLAAQLQKEFASSPQFAWYQRGAFSEQ